jgi:hypothetical protein
VDSIEYFNIIYPSRLSMFRSDAHGISIYIYQIDANPPIPEHLSQAVHPANTAWGASVHLFSLFTLLTLFHEGIYAGMPDPDTRSIGAGEILPVKLPKAQTTL